jgi:heterodisulfide reductase subunit A-like polyferredoxin
MTYDAMEIGAGLSGLAATFDLVDQGRKVLLIEAAVQIAGEPSQRDGAGSGHRMK